MVLALLLLAGSSFGQKRSAGLGVGSVTITPKKTIYRRKGSDIPKYKKTFTVRYPIIGGAIKPAVKTRLENTISYWRVFDRTLKDCLTEDVGLDSLDYTVNYNQNGVLDITLTDDHSGAYPDTQNVNLVIDLQTGKQVKFADVFKPDAKFAEMVNKKLEAEKKQIIKDIDSDKTEDKEAKDSLKEQVNALSFTVENFDEFRVSNKGVTILYDAGFPHVIQALQPAGEYFFTFAALKPYIKTGGMLGRFAR